MILCFVFYFLLNGYSQDGPVSCGPISKKSFNPVLTLRDEFHNKPTDVDLFAPQGTWVIFASQLPKNKYFNQKIRINSDLIVDVPLMFINCELEMLHVNIEIISGGELRLFNSRMFAFTTTWDGIEVKDNGFLVLARNRIEDAENAVSIDIGAKGVNLNGNIFNRNRVAIRNGVASFTPGIMKFGYFADNIFTCSSLLYQNSPSDPDWSIAGIQLDNCVATITSNVNKPNHFFRLENGIKSHGASYVINNCYFYDNFRIDEGNNKIGYAINANGGTVNVSYGFSQNLGLLNCYFGTTESENPYIWTQKASCRVSKACFEGGDQFIFNTDNNSGQVIDIWQNNMDLKNYTALGGVETERPVGSGNFTRVTYTENKVRLSAQAGGKSDFSAGLFLHSNYSSTDRTAITRNEVNVYNNGWGNVGICLVGTGDNNFIKYNTVKSFSEANGNRQGLALHSSKGKNNYIAENTVDGQGDRHNFTSAFFADESPGISWCHNHADYSGIGFHFRLNCDYTKFRSNVNRRHDIGLFIEGKFGTGLIGEQVRRSNLWSYTPDVDYTILAAKCEGNAAYSRFITEGEYIEIKPTKIDPQNDWFVYKSGILDNCNNEQLPIIDTTSVYDRSLINNDTTGWTAYELWHSTKALMKRMIEDPAGTSADVGKYYFYNTHLNTNVGKLADIEVQWRNKIETEDTYSIIIGQSVNNINRLMDEIVSLQSQLVTDTVHYESDSTFEVSRDAKLDSIVYYRNAEEDARASLLASRTPFYNTVKNILANMVPQNQFEQNAIQYNKILIDKWMGNGLTASQLDSLEAIASQCIQKGGEYVKLSAQLLGSKKLKYYMATENITCTEPRAAEHINGQKVSEMARLYPNPTEGILSIEVSLPADYIIYDALERVVEAGSLEEGSRHQLDMSGFQSGIYYVKFSFVDGSSLVSKIIKI